MSNIVISGAGRGIGYYMAEQLLADNHQVAVLDLNTDGLAELKNRYGNRLQYHTCDVSKADEANQAVAQIVKEFGSIDCAVHNACKCTFDSMENTGEDTYKSVFDVNYFGALHLSKATLPFMKAQKSGRIFFTSSGVGVTGFVNISPYASSKAAIEALAKCMNIEYSGTGITVHILHPPLTRTASSKPLPVPDEFMADPEKVGVGLAKRMLKKKKFIISNSAFQGMQTKMCYLFPVAFGKLLSKMTSGYKRSNLE